MTFSKRLWIFFTMMALLAACVTQDFQPLGKRYPPLDESAEVALFLTQVPAEYEEIGTLTIEVSQTSTYYAKVEARKAGGNGLILVVPGVPGHQPAQYAVIRFEEGTPLVNRVAPGQLQNR